MVAGSQAGFEEHSYRGGLWGQVFLGLPGKRVLSIAAPPQNIQAWDPEQIEPDVDLNFLPEPAPEPAVLEGFWRANHDAYFNKGLTLKGARLYVDGNLTVHGDVEGKGALAVTEKALIGGNVDISTDGDLSLYGGEGVYLQGFLEDACILDATAPAGSTELEVISTGDLAEGDIIAICPGCPNEETNQIAGFGSLILATPLQFDHAAGEPVVKIGSAPSPTPTPTPTPTITPTVTPTPVPSPTPALTPTLAPTPSPTPTPPGVTPTQPVGLPATGGGGVRPSPMGWPWAAVCLGGAAVLMLAGTVWSLRRWNRED